MYVLLIKIMFWKMVMKLKLRNLIQIQQWKRKKRTFENKIKINRDWKDIECPWSKKCLALIKRKEGNELNGRARKIDENNDAINISKAPILQNRIKSKVNSAGITLFPTFCGAHFVLFNSHKKDKSERVRFRMQNNEQNKKNNKEYFALGSSYR